MNLTIKAKELSSVVSEDAEIFDEAVMESHIEEPAPCSVSQERKTSNTVLALLGLFLLVFIVTMIVIFCVKGSVPDTLIQYTMGAGGLEALVLAGIKASKVLAGDRPSSDPPDGVG